MITNRIKITSDFSKSLFPEISIDGNVIAVTGYNLTWNIKEVPTIGIDMFLKDAEVEIDGIVKINNCEVPDFLAKEIYEILKKKFGNDLTIQLPKLESNDEPV